MSQSWFSSDRYYVDDGMILDQACLLPVLAHYSLVAVSPTTPKLNLTERSHRETSLEEKQEKG